jgi:hypothetical protein
VWQGKLSLRIREFFEAGAELGRIEELVSFVQITWNPDARDMMPSLMDIHRSRRRGSATTHLRQDLMTSISQPDRRYTFGLKIRQLVRLWRDWISSGRHHDLAGSLTTWFLLQGMHLYRRNVSKSIKGEYRPYWGYPEDMPVEDFVSIKFPCVTPPSTRKSFSQLLIETDTLDKGPLVLFVP